ncbi:MAG: gfo/Idh/MocA family oxidoreductase [Candidatus Eisenbacteria bacterium]|nr:gfo/Idh/MocA family oxidoreductase [Candidatus Eisenbacteria bacterium]
MTGAAAMPAAVIGAGHLGTFHARLYAKQSPAQLVAVVDIVPERAEALARETGAEAHTTLDSVLARVGAVTVATPTTTHHDIVLRCLEAGCHVLVEKPIASTGEEAQRMVRAARERGLVLAVGHTERFNPAFRMAETLVGTPRFIEAHRLASFVPRSLDIDVVLDLMIHDLDLATALMPAGVERVEASGVGVITPREDIANARLTFAGGAVANLTASRISREKMRKIRIFGDGQYLSVDLAERTLQRAWLADEAPSLPERIRWESQTPEAGNPLRDEICDFLEAAAAGRPPRVPGEIGAMVLELALDVRGKVRESLAHAAPELARRGLTPPPV